jgi:dipeptidyl aminopeptidase/acylaminoacyl peptidase
MRSRQFRDAGYTEFTQVGIDDHIAVISQFAERHVGMDLGRVGIYGWSWGGTFSAQAILSRPQFYKVSISGAGVYDYAAMYSNQFDNMVGPPRYEDGSPFRGAEAESPVNWRKLDITSLAGNLEGRLMIVYCDMDENVPSQQAFRLVDALTRAGKPYDLVYLANRTHAAKSDLYYIRRTWDYFLQYLMAPADSARIRRAAPTSTRPAAPARH